MPLKLKSFLSTVNENSIRQASGSIDQLILNTDDKNDQEDQVLRIAEVRQTIEELYINLI